MNPETRDDLNEEQQVVAAILVHQGRSPDEALRMVRDERMLTAYLGAHLRPILEDLAGKWTELLNEWQRSRPEGTS